MKHSLLAVGIAAAACMSQPALAGRPMATEDAGVLDAKACELESFVGRTRTPGAASSFDQSVQIGCGVGWNSQVALATTRQRSDGSHSRGLNLVGKTRLNPDADQDATQFTLAWSWEQDNTAGQGLRHAGSLLNLVATHGLAEGRQLHANLAWQRDAQARQDTTRWSVGLEQAVHDTLDLTAETYGDDRERSVWLQFGARWAVVPQRLYLDTSWARPMKSQADTVVTLGLRLAF